MITGHEEEMNSLEDRTDNTEMKIWFSAKLQFLEEELKAIESLVAPDYVQDKDIFGNDVMRSEMIKDEIKDIKIALQSLRNESNNKS